MKRNMDFFFGSWMLLLWWKAGSKWTHVWYQIVNFLLHIAERERKITQRWILIVRKMMWEFHSSRIGFGFGFNKYGKVLNKSSPIIMFGVYRYRVMITSFVYTSSWSFKMLLFFGWRHACKVLPFFLFISHFSMLPDLLWHVQIKI